MVETADLGQLHDLAHARWMDSPRLGCVLPERQMRSGLVVVGEAGLQDPTEMPPAEDDDMVEAFSTYRIHKALRIRVLPRTPRRGEHLLESHALDPTTEVVAVDAVAIADDVPGRRVPGQGFDDLLGSPGGAGMLGDVEVDHAVTVMNQGEEDEEDAEGPGGNGEEVDGCRRAEVVVEEGAPGPRGLDVRAEGRG
jgi:hypothetical protein